MDVPSGAGLGYIQAVLLCQWSTCEAKGRGDGGHSYITRQWMGKVARSKHPSRKERQRNLNMPHPVPVPPAVKRIISNPVATRSDLVSLLHALLTPLAAAQSEGGARVRVGFSGTHFDTSAAELEGYARAMWGLTPLLAAEPDRPEFAEMRKSWAKGLASGTDPKGEEYWGDSQDKDQRFVEMAALVSRLLYSSHTTTPESRSAAFGSGIVQGA